MTSKRHRELAGELGLCGCLKTQSGDRIPSAALRLFVFASGGVAMGTVRLTSGEVRVSAPRLLGFVGPQGICLCAKASLQTIM